MSATRPMTLHILVSDRDIAFAGPIISHQIAVLGAMCDEVLLVVNRPPSSRATSELDEILNAARCQHPRTRVHEVSYSSESIASVSQTYFGGEPYPIFDFKGVPIHAYLESYSAANNEFVFHSPSDLLYGGSAAGWADIVLPLFDATDPPLMVAPLAGPPHQGPYGAGGADVSDAFPGAGSVHRLTTFRGRCHVLHLDRFAQSIAPLPLVAPARRSETALATLGGLPRVDHLEVMIGRRMSERGLHRLDVGGPGELWTLHPLYKSKRFVNSTPELIDMVRSGEVPTDQVGNYDLVEDLDPRPPVSRIERIRTAWNGRANRPRPLWSSDL
ncbi:MAG: hypothetical protein ACR2QO_09245 [Acidimicrobiales bacterium]